MKAKSKISGMLHSSFKPDKCKTSLKLAVARIKLLKNKREVLIKQMRRDLAQLLDAGQDQTARIRVEHVIREEKTMAAYDLIDIYCELIVARMAIIDSQKNCPIDLKEAISSVVFASPRCADIPELMDIRKHFVAKYGKEFMTAALEVRPDSGVSRLIVEKLSAKAPDIDTKIKVLTEIAKEHNINWNPKAFEEQIHKPKNDLLDGPNTFTGASNMAMDSSIPKPPYSESWNNEPPTSASQKFLANEQTKPDFNVQTPTNSDFSKASGEVRYAYAEDKNASSSRSDWNMEFKDAASAAKAAAESAEMASMAARAAAELASQGNVPLQSSSGQYVSSIYSTKGEQFKPLKSSKKESTQVEEAKSEDYSRKNQQHTNLNMHNVQSDEAAQSSRRVDKNPSEIHVTTGNLTPKRSHTNDESVFRSRDENKRVDKNPSEIHTKTGKLTPKKSLKDDSESEDILYEDDGKADGAVHPSFSETEDMFKNFDYYENQASDSSNQKYEKSASSHHDVSYDNYAIWDDHESTKKVEDPFDVNFDHYESDTDDHSFLEKYGKDNLFNPTLSKQREESADFSFNRNTSNKEQHRSEVVFNQSKSGLFSAAETKDMYYAETILDVNSKLDDNMPPSYDSDSENDDELDILANKEVTKVSSFLQRNSNTNKSLSPLSSDNREEFTNVKEEESIPSFPDIDDKNFEDESSSTRKKWSKLGSSVRNKQQTPRAKSPQNLYDSGEGQGKDVTSYSFASDESYTSGALNIGRLKGGLKNRGYGSPKAENFLVGSFLGPKQGIYKTSVHEKNSNAAEYSAISEVSTMKNFDKDLDTTYASSRSSRVSVDTSVDDKEKGKATGDKSALVRKSVISQFDDDVLENQVQESHNHRLGKEQNQFNLRSSLTKAGYKARKEYSFATRTEYQEENLPVEAREGQDVLPTSDRLKSSRLNKMMLASETQDEELSSQKRNVGSRMQSRYSDSDYKAEERENVTKRANEELKISRRMRGAQADSNVDVGSGTVDQPLRSSQFSPISEPTAKVSGRPGHLDSKVIPKSTSSYSYTPEPPAEQVDNVSSPVKGTKWSFMTGGQLDSKVISESKKSYSYNGEPHAEQVDNLSSPNKGAKWSRKTEDVRASFPEKDGNETNGSPSAKQISRENSFKNSSHVHPKLPDYETLAAHFHSLRSNNLLNHWASIATVLSAMLNHWASIFWIPNWVITKVDGIRRRFLWGRNSVEGTRGLALVAWRKITTPKANGGLGIRDIREHNVALLCKWLWKLFSDECGLWRNLVLGNYYRRGAWGRVISGQISGFWKGVLKCAEIFNSLASWHFGNGERFSFWNVNWSGCGRFRDFFPLAFSWNRNQGGSIKAFFCSQANGWRIKLKGDPPIGAFFQARRLEWTIKEVWPSSGTDKVRWGLEGGRGIFSTSSCYNRLADRGVVCPVTKNLFRLTLIPLKLRFFGWLMFLRRLATNEYLVHLGMNLDPRCFLCNSGVDSVNHIFWQCEFLMKVWEEVGARLASFSSWWNSWSCPPQFEYIFLEQEGKLPHGLVEVVLWFFWMVWLERNNRCFNSNSSGKDHCQLRNSILRSWSYWSP